MTPPTELPWATPLSELVTAIYDLSDELSANPPRLLVEGNRLQLNWQESGAPEPASFSIIDITFSARPHAPAVIGIKQPEAAPVPVIESLTPATGPAGTDLTLDIVGTGLDAEPTINVGNAYGLVPSAVSPTALSVTIKAGNIAMPGILPVSVSTRGGQSNALDLTVT